MPTVTHIIDQNLPVYATGNQIINGQKTFKSTGIFESGIIVGRPNLDEGNVLASDYSISKIIKLTQVQYDQLSSKDPKTFYVIIG